MRVVALSVLVLGLLAGTGVRSQEGGGDKEKIQGTWKIVSFEAFGMKEIPPEVLKESRMTITADKISYKLGGEMGELGYKLDPSKQPKAIDLLEKKGGKEIVIPGIYLLDGDNLKLCWDANVGPWPKEFSKKGEGGQDLRLVILKRERKK